jgi:DNA-binding response OmpR family regulator
MPNAESLDERLSRQSTIRPVVLLAIDDEALSATLAYELTASGFDVAMTDVEARAATRQPDVIVAALSTESAARGLSTRIPRNNPRVDGVPIVAVARDISETTRSLARREGCAAVCLASCTGAALAVGLRALLDHSEP